MEQGIHFVENPVMLLNVSIEICGIMLSLIGIVVAIIARLPAKRDTRMLLSIFICLGIALAGNLCALLFKGHSGRFAWWMVHAGNFFEFCFSYVDCLLFAFLLLSRLAPSKAFKRVGRGLVVSYVLYVLLIVVNQQTGWVYYIDDANIYHRGPWHWVTLVLPMAVLMVVATLLVRHGKQLNARTRRAYWIFIVAPFAALVIQLFFYGIYLILFSMVIGGCVLLVVIIGDSVDLRLQQQHQLTEMKAALAMSQMRPHFLFNSLGVIRDLCRHDPEQARTALDDFSRYLRCNLDTMGKTGTIPFAQELRHVQAYLNLEKLRFGERLSIAYDLRCKDFSLPPLTLQPLVENAVKHGVFPQEGGGTVTLRSWREGGAVFVQVEDDGAGFDTSADPNSALLDDLAGGFDGAGDAQRRHVGIENVRNRLELYGGCSLSIESQPGAGTVATIRLNPPEE